jgi:hypothetical protein
MDEYRGAVIRCSLRRLGAHQTQLLEEDRRALGDQT